MESVFDDRRPIILGLGVMFGLVACVSSPFESSDFEPIGIPTRDQDLVHEPVSLSPSERDSDELSSFPASTRSISTPTQTHPSESNNDSGIEPGADPGARDFLHAMLSTVDQPNQGEDGVTRIGLNSLRNQSRSSRQTFESMRRTLMELLTRAGQDRHVVFTDAEEIALQYRLEGTAYRLNGEQSQRWELFLQLHQEEDGVLVWEPDGAVQIQLSGPAPNEGPTLRISP